MYFHSPSARDNTVATREISRHISRVISPIYHVVNVYMNHIVKICLPEHTGVKLFPLHNITLTTCLSYGTSIDAVHTRGFDTGGLGDVQMDQPGIRA